MGNRSGITSNQFCDGIDEVVRRLRAILKQKREQFAQQQVEMKTGENGQRETLMVTPEAAQTILEKYQKLLGKTIGLLQKIQNTPRRLAALPLSHEPLSHETSFLPGPELSALSLGVVATAGLCLAFV